MSFIDSLILLLQYIKILLCCSLTIILHEFAKIQYIFDLVQYYVP